MSLALSTPHAAADASWHAPRSQPFTFLTAAASAWFCVAVAGQLIFVMYILSFYAGSAINSDFAAWNKILPRGHVPGDAIGNVAMAIHVLIAAVVTIGGPLQLVPAMRTRFPKLHRVNGRIYLATVVTASLSGLYLVWTRSGVDSFMQHMTISINAVLILVAAWYTVRHAIAHQMAAHRRWALRLFLVVSGSWFFRVILMFWIVINGGPAGFDPATFTGPALVAIGLLQYLLPLAVLELYFSAQRSSNQRARAAVVALIFVLTVAMAVGIGVATMGLWLPNIL